MIKLAVIGSQGMLGSAVSRFLSKENYQILEINSAGKTLNSNPVMQFDIAVDDLDKLGTSLQGVDFVINCAGLIKHKIEESSKESLNNVIRVNSLFPIQLTEISNKFNFKIIQVATDCVYSGDIGNYSESDIKDPVDLYGYSKVLGEHSDNNLITLRCSLIGRELSSKVEFLEWVLNHHKADVIRGFTDHIWNGLTTLHFAKIINGIIKGGKFKAGTFHLIPRDSLSKYELAKLILECFGRTGTEISQSQSNKAINRTLTTNYQEFNQDMWRNAGYYKPPSISEMLKEYVLWS